MFEPVIGLEVHAQISTRSKMFCRCSNDFFGKESNTVVCPICMGFPGMLPVINKEAVEKAIRAALALHCSIPEFCKFDRKNYFYPDLPKGFQISQYDRPISAKGYVEIDAGGQRKKVGVHRLHLEDDAGKLTHVADGTLCDYNRSGSPLMEIVSEPEIFSIEEAFRYAQELRRILRYVGASECDMEKGMMRFDINVSLRQKGEKKLGIKVEVKNLNSFRALERALRYEIQRQTEILESGGTIVQETRGWDDEKGVTFSQRSKEEAHDYRYFPEPDLPSLTTTREKVAGFQREVPELPLAKKLRFIESYGLSEKDASLLIEELALADYFEAVVKQSKDPKTAISFVGTVLLRHLNEDGKSISKCPVSPQALAELILLIQQGKISNNMAKSEVFGEMYKTGKSPSAIVAEKGLQMESDTDIITNACKKMIEQNHDAVESYRKGKTQALGVLVGMVMKETKGQANPKLVNEILRNLLG